MEILIGIAVVVLLAWLALRAGGSGRSSGHEPAQAGTRRVPEEHVDALDSLLRDRILVLSLGLLRDNPRVEDEEAAAALKLHVEPIMGTPVLLSSMTMTARYVLANYRLGYLRAAYSMALQQEDPERFEAWVEEDAYRTATPLPREWYDPPGAEDVAHAAREAVMKRYRAKFRRAAGGRDAYFAKTERRLLAIVKASPFTPDLRRYRDK